MKDHEQRLTELENKWRIAIGVAVVLGVGAGTLGSYLKGAFDEIEDLNTKLETIKTKLDSVEDIAKEVVADISASQNAAILSIDQHKEAAISQVYENAQEAVIEATKYEWGTLINDVADLKSNPRWPNGTYVILKNGNCPIGWSAVETYARAMPIYAATSQYMKGGKFGESSVVQHGNDTRADIFINACVKNS